MANAYQYAANKGKQAARSTAVKEASVSFLDQYGKAQDIAMKRQEMLQKARSDATSDPLKQFAQMAAMAEQGLISPDVMRAVSPYANASVMQSLGIQPQYAPQVQAQAPMVGGQQFGAGVAPQQAPNLNALVTPEQETKAAGEVFKQSALMPGEVQQTKEKKIATDIGGLTGGAVKSAVTSDYNLDVVSNALLPLSQTMANAYMEGGAGNVIKKSITGLAQAGWLPEDMQEDLSESTAVSGKRTEVLLKMMPLMSSQYGKEGSTRIIKTVFDKLGESIPNLENAPLNSIKMIENSVDTLYGVVRAVNNVNLDNYDITNEADMKKLTDKIVVLTKNLEIVGEEKEAIDALKTKVTGPIRAYREAKKRGLV